ncbi:hypothetical protein R1sor_020658 [Riccia sorocarpa]|uniref:ArsA/GET3 Anion-transporting ATPase-like domain-containing protein n=1 Tax=Riccia sorocarpa TaxID=122646 RepID=A0ABD3GET3_9MARC
MAEVAVIDDGALEASLNNLHVVQLANSLLIISTDPAHNLSDAFRQKFTRSPSVVQSFSNLYAMEIDPTVETEELDQFEGMGGFVSELANAIPGIDETICMSLAEMLKLVHLPF